MTQAVVLGSVHLSIGQVHALTSLEPGYAWTRQPFYLATLAEETENLTLGTWGDAKAVQPHNQPLSSGGLGDTRGHHLQVLYRVRRPKQGHTLLLLQWPHWNVI